jgi:hypothetical protein
LLARDTLLVPAQGRLIGFARPGDDLEDASVGFAVATLNDAIVAGDRRVGDGRRAGCHHDRGDQHGFG